MTSFSQIVNGDAPKRDIVKSLDAAAPGPKAKKTGGLAPPRKPDPQFGPKAERGVYFKASPLAAPCILISTFSVRPS
jgi:hypothetical protein